MSRHHYDHIRSNPGFHKLVARQSRLSWSLAAMIMLVYFSFILVIAFAPDWLGTPLGSGTTLTWGLPIGIGIILFTFLITGIYVHRANTTYDALLRDVVSASNEHVSTLQVDSNTKHES
ncbi:MAG: DUF485 domain-containing protein [Gammaproteobacteria bacterium]|nr:DUF485 domain-containing protein [Gammaproteobacteria bacterium]